jgi:hypothetical protein
MARRAGGDDPAAEHLIISAAWDSAVTQSDSSTVLDIFGPGHLGEYLSPRVARLKAVFGFDEHTGQFTKLPPKPIRQDILTHILFDRVSRERKPRKPRKPTLASVAKQASKAGIEVARYEVKSDSINIITGKGEPVTPENPWLVDLHRRETKR